MISSYSKTKFFAFGFINACLLSGLFFYTNCAKRTFSVSTVVLQQRMSEGAAIFINNDDEFTNASDASLAIENRSATEMYITNTEGCGDGGVWEPYASSRAWVLKGTNRETKVYAKFREEVGGVESICTSDSIIHDNVPPKLSLVLAPPNFTKNPTVNIKFSATDALSGVAGYTCRNKKNEELPTCEENSSITSAGEGPDLLNVVARDKAGNISTPIQPTWVVDFTPPVLTVNQQPPLSTSQTQSTFQFTANDNYSTNLVYECHEGAASYTSCASPLVYNLAEGPHTVQIRVTDEAKNSTEYTYMWNIEAAVPTVAITSHPAPITNSTAAAFSFMGVNNSQIVRYECRLDSGAYAACAPPKQYTGLSSAPHTFYVVGYNGDNIPSSPASYTWQVDTINPTVTITAGPAAETMSTSATILFNANDVGSGVDYTQCRINNQPFQSCSNQFNAASLADGSYTFQVQAFDVATNPSAIVSRTWIVDTVAPVIQFTKTPSNPTNVLLAEFTALATDSSPSPLVYECRLDNQLNYEVCMAETAFVPATQGVHNYYVRARDAAGNVSVPPASYKWLLDSIGPAINFSESPLASSSIFDPVRVSFSVTDDYSTVSEVQCGLNGAFAACSTMVSRNYDELPVGSYTFTVNARDSLGNPSTKTINWAVKDTTRLVNQPVTVTQNKKVDVVVIIDNSGSMNPEQKNMASRFASFLDKLAGFDWRVGIITTDVTTKNAKSDGQLLPFSSTRYYIDSDMTLTSAKDLFAKTIQRPADEGSGAEQGIAAAYRSVERTRDAASVTASDPNRSFFRASAALSMLVVTDSDETNPKGTEKQNVPSNLVDLVQNIWPSKAFIYNSIIVKTNDSNCLGQAGNEKYGKTYERASFLTDGEVGSVCAADYTNQLQRIAEASTDLVKVITLNCIPVDKNQDGNLVDDVIIRLENGSIMPVARVSGQTVTASSALPLGTHTASYSCLQ